MCDVRIFDSTSWGWYLTKMYKIYSTKQQLNIYTSYKFKKLYFIWHYYAFDLALIAILNY